MITTVTMNPALDKLLSTEQIEIGETNRTIPLSMSVGGKGIDVAKVLRDMNVEVTATGFLGGEVAPIFTERMRIQKIVDRMVAIRECTRTNIQLFDAQGRRTELLEKGPEVTPEERRTLMEQVEELSGQSSVVAVCGSAPGGVDTEYYLELLRAVKRDGAALVTDVSGELLKAALTEHPSLIKPNRSEILELMGKDDAPDREIALFAQQLVRDGIGYVLVSLGAQGAMLACGDGVWRGRAPDVPVKSTLGCGDTMVASFCISMQQGLEPAEMLQNAIALSSANAMTMETAHIIPEDYRNLLPRCRVEKAEF